MRRTCPRPPSVGGFGMIDFIKRIIRSTGTVGTLAPGGRFLVEKMTVPIDFGNAKLIVELGAGTGAYSREIASCKNHETRFVVIEQNKSFCRAISAWVKKKGIENVRIVCGSFAQAAEIVEAEKKIPYNIPADTVYESDVQEPAMEQAPVTADYVISSLPFKSLPGELSRDIVRAVKKILGEDGRFITLAYSKSVPELFLDDFELVDTLKEIRNVPPAYIFVMKNKAAEPAREEKTD